MALLLLKSESHVAGHLRDGTWVRDYVRRAAHFAAGKHKGQYRKDGRTPYISHPVRAANILAREGGVDDPELIAATFFHDLLEDTESTHSELASEFGQRVADLVKELTNPTSGDKKAAQLAKEYSPAAATIKIADKIANLRDILSAPPPDWDAARKRRYFEHANELVQRIGRHHPRLAAVFRQVYDHGMSTFGSQE